MIATNKIMPKIEPVSTRKTKKSKLKYGFYDSIRLTLFLCRCLGLLPISGLTQGSSEKTKQSFKSIYILMPLTSVGQHMFWIVIHVHNSIIREFDLASFSQLFHITISFIFYLRLMFLCYKWPKIVKKIEDIEKNLPPISNGRASVRKIHIWISIIIFLLIVHCVISTIFTVHLVNECTLHENYSFDLYLISVFTWLNRYVYVDKVFAVFLWIARIQFFFVWSFNDMLITVTSMYLVSRFRDFNVIMHEYARYTSTSGVSKPPWLELNSYYTKLTRLVKIVNKNYSFFVVLSFANNLFFIGKQLFVILNNIYRSQNGETECFIIHSSDEVALLNLYSSTAFVLVRTIFVSAIPARLHNLSRQPLNALHSVPASVYNYDLQRFMDQVYYSNNSLSGFGYFSVTRGMILTIFATLITYELVLLQL